MTDEKAPTPPQRIRPVAICIFHHFGKILVQEFYDPLNQASYYRPIGGTIEFGESSADTVTREIEEEINAKVDSLRYLGTLENIFTYNGKVGHDIVQVYDGRFTDPAFYAREALTGFEDPEHQLPVYAVWKSLVEFRGDNPLRLVPDGLVELLEKSGIL